MCGWNIRQIVHQIVDGDDIWKLCLKMALGNEQAEFSLAWYLGQSQQTRTEHWAYTKRSIDTSLALLKANRNYIKQLLEAITGTWSRTAIYRDPKGGTEQVSVGQIVEMHANHVEHHLKRILEIKGEIGR